MLWSFPVSTRKHLSFPIRNWLLLPCPCVLIKALGNSLKQPEERTPTFNPSAAPFNPSTAPFTPSRALVPRGFFDGIAGAIADTVAPRPVPTAPRALVAVPHKAGKACPEAHSECHWHHSQWCHERFYTCAKARM